MGVYVHLCLRHRPKIVSRIVEDVEVETYVLGVVVKEACAEHISVKTLLAYAPSLDVEPSQALQSQLAAAFAAYEKAHP